MVDLHTHSTASDGTVSPDRIPAIAVSEGVSAVALTDHDTVAGIPAFLNAATEFPQLQAIPGVELSADYSGKEVHIVGLFVDHENPELLAFLQRQRESRLRRNDEMKRKLTSLGYPMSWDEPEFTAFSDSSSIGRPHFARVLCRKYGFADTREVFARLLGKNKPAYVRRIAPDPVSAVAAIRAAGGISVWAHPVYRQKNEWSFARRFCKKFKPLGLDAIECYYSLFGPPETAMLSEIAANCGLFRSGGSDFHGENTPDIRIGAGMGKMDIPDEVASELTALYHSRISENHL